MSNIDLEKYLLPIVKECNRCMVKTCSNCKHYKKECNYFKVIPRDFYKDLIKLKNKYGSIEEIKRNINNIADICSKNLCYKCRYYNKQECLEFNISPDAFYKTLNKVEEESR